VGALPNGLAFGKMCLPRSDIVLEIKIKHVRFIAGLAEMNKAPYFTGFSHFGATGRHGGVLHFFSPPQ